MEQRRNIPIGIQSFETMRDGSYIYVDKTKFIPSFERLGCVYFLSRPRRFGKSLFISTLKAYFEGRRELFEGLEIERIKEIEDLKGQTLVSEGIDANYMDIINYAVFGAIKLAENK